jgi:general secretion pathway protein A
MLKHFDLMVNPFSVSPSPRYYYLSKLHRTILAKVDYVVERRQGLTVIFGDMGTGKTTLARLY